MDLILINGKIVTMDKNNPTTEAFAVKDGLFEKIGTNEEILKLKTENTKVIDAQKKLILPGFNDSHMHLVGYGQSLKKVNFTKSKSIEDIIQITKEYIFNNKLEKDSWVSGRGWNQDYFDIKKFPTRYDLDKISKDYPICINRACGHICVVNSKALELCNINENTKQVEGGHFDIDENNEPIGIFRENTMDLILKQIPSPSVNDIKNMILAGVESALSHGITSIQTDDFEVFSDGNYEKIIKAYKELNEESKLKIRIYEQCLLQDIDKLNKFIELGYKTGDGDNNFKIGPLKLLGDGSLGARTAYLSEPYEDDKTTCGINILSQVELDELILNAHKNNI